MKINKKRNYITAVSDEGDRVITEDGDTVIVWSLRGRQAVMLSKRGPWTPNFKKMRSQAQASLIQREKIKILSQDHPSLF